MRKPNSFVTVPWRTNYALTICKTTANVHHGPCRTAWTVENTWSGCSGETRSLTFTHGAALAGYLDGVHAALPTGCSHAVGLPVDTLAEGAVILTPPVPVGSDLAVGVATGGVVDGEHGV